jgi:hypothetical protein
MDQKDIVVNLFQVKMDSDSEVRHLRQELAEAKQDFKESLGVHRKLGGVLPKDGFKFKADTASKTPADLLRDEIFFFINTGAFLSEDTYRLRFQRMAFGR